jgi:hypothetical protein
MWTSLNPLLLENYFREDVTPCSVIRNVRIFPKHLYINCTFCVVIPQTVLPRAITTVTSNPSLFYMQPGYVQDYSAVEVCFVRCKHHIHMYSVLLSKTVRS